MPSPPLPPLPYLRTVRFRSHPSLSLVSIYLPSIHSQFLLHRQGRSQEWRIESRSWTYFPAPPLLLVLSIRNIMQQLVASSPGRVLDGRPVCLFQSSHFIPSSFSYFIRSFLISLKPSLLTHYVIFLSFSNCNLHLSPSSLSLFLTLSSSSSSSFNPVVGALAPFPTPFSQHIIPPPRAPPPSPVVVPFLYITRRLIFVHSY